METLIVGALLALLGGMVGYGFRTRETLRNERRLTYVRFLRGLDGLPILVAQAIESATGEIDWPDAKDEVANEIAQAEQELSLIGSQRVLDAAHQARHVIEISIAVAGNEIPTYRKAADGLGVSMFLMEYWQDTKVVRDDLVNAMRRDLGVKKLDHSAAPNDS